MKIESANISMASAHMSYERTSASFNIEHWTQRPALPPADNALINLSSADNEVGETDSPQMSLLIAMIEQITGQKMRLFRMQQLTAPARQLYAPPIPPKNLGSGPGSSVQIPGERVEHEQVGFAASGVIRTSDGQEIRFELAFAMERRFVEQISIDIQTGASRQLKDPLVLDFAGTGASLQDARFAFDLDADGTDEEIPLPMGGRGFLAIDRNSNGVIDDGRELFGPMTGNGFNELAALDADGNGWIDAADPAFAQLRLWQREVHGAGRLMTLAEAGVGALFLGNVATPFTLRDGSNNTLGLMRSSSIYVGTDGRVGTVSQIDLAV